MQERIFYKETMKAGNNRRKEKRFNHGWTPMNTDMGKDIEQEGTERKEIGRKRTQRTQKGREPRSQESGVRMGTESGIQRNAHLFTLHFFEDSKTAGFWQGNERQRNAKLCEKFIGFYRIFSGVIGYYCTREGRIIAFSRILSIRAIFANWGGLLAGFGMKISDG